MSNRRKALLSCANWDTGKCIGCLIKCELDGTILMRINKKMEGKDCDPKGCKYFEELVLPVLL